MTSNGVHVHGMPIRVFHLVSVVCMTVLLVTGLYINHPFANWNMGVVRYLHLVAGYGILANMVLRISCAYWGKCLDAKEFHVRFKDLPDMLKTMEYYLLLRKDHPKNGKYNPVQRLAYLSLIPMLTIQGLTGIVLNWPTTFGFAVNMVGGLGSVRGIHVIFTWILAMLVMVHIYLVFMESRDQIVSMFNILREEEGFETGAKQQSADLGRG